MEKTFKFTCSGCGKETETNDEYAPATCLNCLDKEMEASDNEIKDHGIEDLKEPEVK